MQIQKVNDNVYSLEKEVNGKMCTTLLTHDEMWQVYQYMHRESFVEQVESYCWDEDIEISAEELQQVGAEAYDLWLSKDISEEEATLIAVGYWKNDKEFNQKG